MTEDSSHVGAALLPMCAFGAGMHMLHMSRTSAMGSVHGGDAMRQRDLHSPTGYHARSCCVEIMCAGYRPVSTGIPEKLLVFSLQP